MRAASTGGCNRFIGGKRIGDRLIDDGLAAGCLSMSITGRLSLGLLLLALLLLGLLGLLAWQWPTGRLQDVLSGSIPEVKTFPLSYMLDMKTTQYRADGGLAYRLEAIEFAYYEGQGQNAEARRASAYATLKRPFITLYSRDAPPWQLSAASGESRNEGQLVTLIGDVRLWQVQDGVVTAELTTQSLAIMPAEGRAHTDQPVVATGIGGTMTATGATLFAKDNRIEFLSRVRGIYEKP